MRMIPLVAALMAGTGVPAAEAQEAAFESRTTNTVHLREGEARPSATLDQAPGARTERPATGGVQLCTRGYGHGV